MAAIVTPDEIATLVKCNLAAQTANVPHSFTFHPRTGKLLFLGATSSTEDKGKPPTTLNCVDLPEYSSAVAPDAPIPHIPWHTLAIASAPEVVDQSQPDHIPAVEDDELLRERLRMHSVGISFYFLHDNSGNILVPLNGGLHYITVPSQRHPATLSLRPLGGEFDWTSTGHSPPLGPSPDADASLKRASDPKWSPDGTMTSFIRDGDIYVMDVRTGLERQLTFSRNVGQSVSSGVAEYIMQEEFDRYTGYWWTQNTDDNTEEWSILYLQVDEQHVPLLNLPRLNFEGDIDRWCYPRVGEQNARSEPRIVRIPKCAALDTSSPLAIDVATDWASNSNGESYIWSPKDTVKDRFPWAEYVVRAGWIPTHKTRPSENPWFWLLLLNREQTKSSLIAFSTAGESIILREETRTRLWINVSDTLIWLPAESSNTAERSFIFTSEESGFSHLYLGHVVLSESSQATSVQLTSGPWMVESLVRHDAKRKLLYFTATKDTVLERHLYAVSYDQSSEDSIILLTETGNMHSGFSMDQSARWCVCNSSSLKSPPSTSIFVVDHTHTTPQLKQVAWIDNPRPQMSQNVPWTVRPPKLFTFEVEKGVTLHGCVYLPLNGGEGPKPTILNTYGGPHVQYVSNDYRLTQNLKNQLIASKGYAVMMVDGRGSYRRGLEFEGAIHEHLGEIELSDQMAAVTYLASQGIVDVNRVAMSGWSYGGYMSLMALSKHPEFFRIAVAGAPVVRWEAYDTGYTERYLGLIADNAAGYKSSSVLTHLEGLPEEAERLLVVHSVMDENVHFCHTSILVDSLIQMNKPHRLVVFPKERHGLRSPAAQLYFERVFFDFISTRL